MQTTILFPFMEGRSEPSLDPLAPGVNCTRMGPIANRVINYCLDTKEMPFVQALPPRYRSRLQ